MEKAIIICGLKEANIEVYPTRAGLYIPSLKLSINPHTVGYILQTHFDDKGATVIRTTTGVLEHIGQLLENKSNPKVGNHGLSRSPED